LHVTCVSVEFKPEQLSIKPNSSLHPVDLNTD